MSTAPTTPQVSPGVTAFLNHFNAVAAVAAATIAQEQKDFADHASFAQKLNDAVMGAGESLAAVVPVWAPDIAAGFAAFQTGLAIVSSLFSLFHHHSAASAPPAAAPAPAAPSAPAVSGAN